MWGLTFADICLGIVAILSAHHANKVIAAETELALRKHAFLATFYLVVIFIACILAATEEWLGKLTP